MRIASREKLVKWAKSLARAAKDVARDESVDEAKREAARFTAQELRRKICQASVEDDDIMLVCKYG